MLISQVIQRLQELQRVESDVEVVLQDEHGEFLYNYWLDIYQDDTGMRRVGIYRYVEVVKEEVLDQGVEKNVNVC